MINVPDPFTLSVVYMTTDAMPSTSGQRRASPRAGFDNRPDDVIQSAKGNIRVTRRLALAGQRLSPSGAHGIGHLLPHSVLPNAFDIVEGIIKHAVKRHQEPIQGRH